MWDLIRLTYWQCTSQIKWTRESTALIELGKFVPHIFTVTMYFHGSCQPILTMVRIDISILIIIVQKSHTEFPFSIRYSTSQNKMFQNTCSNWRFHTIMSTYFIPCPFLWLVELSGSLCLPPASCWCPLWTRAAHLWTLLHRDADSLPAKVTRHMYTYHNCIIHYNIPTYNINKICSTMYYTLLMLMNTPNKYNVLNFCVQFHNTIISIDLHIVMFNQ